MLGVGACVIDTCGRAFAIFFKVDYYLLAFLVYFSIYFIFYFSFTPFIFLNTVLVSRVGLLVYCVVCV